MNIIAEIKRRSPSKGVIREDFDPESYCRELHGQWRGGISVLTEEDFFDGSLGVFVRRARRDRRAVAAQGFHL